MTFLLLWTFSALLIPAIHLLPALLIDGRIALGTWTRFGLALFMLLGPLGLLLEIWLLTAVLTDLVAEWRATPRPLRRRFQGRSPYLHRWPVTGTGGFSEVQPRS